MTGTDSGNGERRSEHDGAAGAESVLQGARHLIEAAETLSTEVGAALREELDRRPYVVLGLGFLGGYVLGGGLTLRVGALVLGTVGRAALAGVLDRVERDNSYRGDR